MDADFEIKVLCASYKRLRKRGKPVEETVSSLNKLGSRRPTKQRFSLVYDHKTGVLQLRAKSTEHLPVVLRAMADQLVLDNGESQNVVNT